MTDSDTETAERRAYFLWGFGPLVAAAVLFVLMVLLAPSVAPERIVEKPVNPAPAAGPPGR